MKTLFIFLAFLLPNYNFLIYKKTDSAYNLNACQFFIYYLVENNILSPAFNITSPFGVISSSPRLIEIICILFGS